MKMTETCGWIWLKPTNVICLNLTENWQRRTFTMWTWPKTIELDQKSKILKIMAQRRTFMIEYDPNRKFNRFSVHFYRQCSMLWQILLELSVKFTKLTFVVVSFRSHSQISVTFTDFSHIHSVIFTRSS